VALVNPTEASPLPRGLRPHKTASEGNPFIHAEDELSDLKVGARRARGRLRLRRLLAFMPEPFEES
jgi:hypothetical protein